MVGSRVTKKRKPERGREREREQETGRKHADGGYCTWYTYIFVGAEKQFGGTVGAIRDRARTRVGKGGRGGAKGSESPGIGIGSK